MNTIKHLLQLSVILIITHLITAVPPRDFYEDQIAEESIDDEQYFTSYALPKHIFNDGKPFVVGKDPVTGQIDFSSKKTVSSSTPNDILDKDMETGRPSDINKIAPNIHDFLNLPVKYSSSKSVYPLISSGYSNLKYQGNNKHYVSNHKDSSIGTTTSPKYYTNTMIVKSTSVTEVEGKVTKRPIVSTSSIAPFTMRTRPITTSTQRSTQKPIFPKTSTTLKPFVFTTTNKYDTKKYQDSALLRKKTSTTSLPAIKLETMKKNNTIQLHTQLNVIPLAKKSTKAPTTISFTSSTTTRTPAVSISTTSGTGVRFPGPSDATIKAQVPSRPITMRPTEEIKPSTPVTKPTKKAPSLSDLFSLWSDADDDEYYDEKEKENQPEWTGNKINTKEKGPELNFVDAPLEMLPSNFKEDSTRNSSSFTVQTTTKPVSTTVLTSTTPKTSTTTIAMTKSDVPTTYSPKTTAGVKFSERTSPTYLPSPVPTKPHQTIGPQSSIQEKHFDLQPTQTIQEQNYVNFGNVNSVPSRNTFVISPGQDSASFVLGSQQSFGNEGHFVGSAIKETVYEPPQNKFPGTVINEGHNPDIIPQGFSIKVAPQAAVRFPNSPSSHPNSSPVSFDNAPIVRGTISNDINSPVPQSLAFEQRPGSTPSSNINNNVNFPTTPHDKKMTPQQMNIEIIKAIDEQLSAESIPGSQVVFKDDTVLNQQSHNIVPPSQDLTPPGDGQYEMPQFFERPGNGQAHPPHIYGDLHRQDQRRPQLHQQPQQSHPGQMQFNGQRIPTNDRPFGHEMHGNNGKPPMRPMPQHQMGPQYRVDRLPNNGPNNRQQVIPDRMLMQDRPEAGQPLPNILPQFRPNAKASQGHNGPKKEAGIIKVVDTPGYKKQPLPGYPQGYHESYPPMHSRPEYYSGKPSSGVRNRPSPTFILRRTPGPNRFISRISPGPYQSYSEEVNPNRRHYYAGPPMADRPNLGPNNMQYAPLPAPPQRFLDPNHPAFRRQLNANGPMIQQSQGVRGEQDLLNRNDQSFQRFLEERQTFPRDLSTTEKPREEFIIRKQGRLEPVVTLQMLHAKKLAMQEKEKNVELPVLKETVQEIPVAIETANDKKNVYVVYPLKEEEVGSSDQQSLGSKFSSVTSTGPEYQNTPFSIASTHFEQEPILTLKEKSKPLKTTQFPYAIEKPNHKSEPESHVIKSGQVDLGVPPMLNTGEQSSEVQSKGHVISTTLTRVTPSGLLTTGSPIAFAFTPTPRPINHKGPHIYDSTSHEMYSMPNIITHESQTEQTYFHDYDYDHRIKEPFQAPFYASANLPNKATPSNTFEGWAIVTQGTPPKFQPHYDNNQIDRADTNVLESETEKMKPEKASLEMTTKPFDPDHFQPEFLTGFQPIYTADTNVKQSAILEPAPREEPIQLDFNGNQEMQQVATNKSVEVSNEKSSSTVKDHVGEEQRPTKKPAKEIDSLEAFFDALVNYNGDDESRSLKNVYKNAKSE